jgi:hypothetical protein
MAYTSINPYVTLQELCDELKRPLPSADGNLSAPKKEALEDELKRAIDRASRWVDDYTRRDYFEHNYSVVPLEIDENWEYVFGDKIFLPWPVLELDRIDLGSTTVEETEYRAGSGSNQYQIFSYFGHWNPTRPDAVVTIYGRFGYSQTVAATYSSANVPQGIPAKITEATRKVAAAFSGHWRKEIFDMEGQGHEVAVNEVPQEVYKLLGKRMPILI